LNGERGAAGIERRLGALERRRRTLALLRALGAWVSVVLPAAALFCFVDWLQHMPLAARWAALVALLALAWFALRKLVLPALRSGRGLDGSALAVERRFPQMADRVITAVQLDRRRGQFGYGSEELKAAAQAQAAEHAARVSFAEAEPLTRYAGPMLLGLAVLVAAARGTATFPRIVGIWALRCFWTVNYPHKTRIESYDRDVLVARGEAAEVKVKAGGLLPGGGRLYVKSENSGWVPRDLEPVEGRRGEYLARVEEVVEPLEFYIELGDAPTESARGAIRVTDRPQVAGIEVKITYPDYTGLPAELFLSGHIRAVPGSAAELTVTASKPLDSAGLLFSGATKVRPMRLGAGGTAAKAGFAIGKSGSYAVHLTDTQGFSNRSATRAPVSYKISAVPDSPPRVTLVSPGAEALATPVTIVRLVYRISDDYGLRRGRLRFRVNDGKEWKGFPLPLPGLDPKDLTGDAKPPGPRRADQLFLWDLSPLGFKVGDMITYRLEAEDHAGRKPPQPGTTGEQVIRVVSPEVIIKKLREDLEVTAKEIERVFLLEKDSQERIRKLLEEIRKLKK